MNDDVGMSFFQGFPCCSFFGALAQFHESGREGPEPYSGLDGPAAEENLILPFRDTARHNFGVFIVDGLARWTHGSEQGFP